MHSFTNRLRTLLPPTRPIQSTFPPSPSGNSASAEHMLLKPNAGEFVPVELFPLILHFVNTDDTRRQVDEYFLERATDPASYDPVSRQLALHKAAPEYTLKSCSLVCLYWATQCRRYIFSDKILRVTSYRQAKAVQYYTIRGSARLTPVVKFVKAVDVEMDVSWKVSGNSEQKPFLGLVYLPLTKGKLRNVYVKGPFPKRGTSGHGDGGNSGTRRDAGFPTWSNASSDNPHASPSVLAYRIPQTVTDYESLALGNLAFPSVAHAIAYIRHFRSARKIDLKSITWNTNASASDEMTSMELGLRQQNVNLYQSGSEVISPRWLPPHHSNHRPFSDATEPAQLLYISATDCTDPVFLAMHTALTLHSTFPLRIVPEADQVWAMKTYRSLYKFYRDVVPLEGNIHARWGYQPNDVNLTKTGGCRFKHCTSCSMAPWRACL
jgi:hypothetical protein